MSCQAPRWDRALWINFILFFSRLVFAYVRLNVLPKGNHKSRPPLARIVRQTSPRQDAMENGTIKNHEPVRLGKDKPAV